MLVNNIHLGPWTQIVNKPNFLSPKNLSDI